MGQRLADVGFGAGGLPDYLLSHGTPLHPRIWPATTASPTRAGAALPRVVVSPGQGRQTVVAGNYRVDLAEAVGTPRPCQARHRLCGQIPAGQGLQSGQLIPLLPQWQPEPEDGGARRLCARREHLDPKIRLFIDFLKECFRTRAYWAQRLAPGSGANCPAWRK